ncbi:hypothetical protein ACFQZO_03945 [Bradyrhizobium sp. GCM10027634]|uniref:hypothetical protein n=1 Tax=unclassified Bradyrhizobium TaxID=2631580 RepID=UPI00188A5A88|nr:MULTISPECIES: hypothetical protein [unclassified Bradyrhizobium]MDN5000032.1 hypothetical protein [Bradyrhizobium sp. WYCCWR 12677]QOZ43172.1 hypothetical protein XH89_06560 [Bradyrhizobium sp. CCBAU 53340]
MAPFALDLILWLADIRGHIPRFDDFRPVPVAPATGAGKLMRVLAVGATVLAGLSLAVWVAIDFL